MSGLARLGHIGRGLNAGVQDFQQMQSNELNLRERQQRMGLNDVQIQRQQQQWQREDQDREILTAARAAGVKALEADRAEYDATPAGLDGAAKSPYAPSRKAILRAAQAESDELFRRGRMDLGVDRWAKAEALRGQMRAQAGQQLMATMAGGGDITGALKELDETVDDGLDIESVKPIKGPDGKQAYEIRHRNRLTGKPVEQPTVATAQDIEMRVAKLMADPKETAKFAFQSYLANLKGEKALEQIDARGDNALSLQDKKNEGSANTAKIRAQGTISAAQIRKAAGGAGGDAGNKVQSKTVLSDGRVALTMRDGSTKIATDDSGKPLTAIDFEKLVGSTAGQVSKTIEGSMATPEANRGRARSMLPQPPAGLPPGLPPGSKQIGTSGGKPVYETPDGKRFLAE